MSRARHHEVRAEEFGKEKHDDEETPKKYNSEEPNVDKEAEKEEKGEKMHAGGRKKRKAGGRMEHEKEVEGHHGKKRYDRPGRKRGGAIGANAHPLSSAATIKDAVDHKAEDGNAEDD